MLSAATVRKPYDEDVRGEIVDFPLIAPFNTARSLDMAEYKGQNVYFGTGVATPKALSAGLPFDYLGMLLTAEWIRKKTGAQGIIQEISDEHATTNPLHDAKKITEIATRQKEQLTRLAIDLGISDSFRCILASEYRASKKFREVQEEVDQRSNVDTPSYIRYQSAGNLYFSRYEGVRCKVGWLVEDNEQPIGLDERTFNNAYDALGIDPIGFVYTWCGRTFDANRPRVSPYTFIDGEKRLLLASTERAASEFEQLISSTPNNKKIIGVAFNHLAKILTAYDKVFGSTGSNFWLKKNQDSSELVIDVIKPETWMPGKYIDTHALFERIDAVRAGKSIDTNRRLAAMGTLCNAGD